MPLGLTVAAPPTDAAIHIKMFGSHVTLLIISNKEMNDIIKIVKSLKESSLLIKGISETIQNQAKGKKIGFLLMLLHTIGPILLKAKDTIRAAEGTFRAGQKF